MRTAPAHHPPPSCLISLLALSPGVQFLKPYCLFLLKSVLLSLLVSSVATHLQCQQPPEAASPLLQSMQMAHAMWRGVAAPAGCARLSWLKSGPRSPHSQLSLRTRMPRADSPGSSHQALAPGRAAAAPLRRPAAAAPAAAAAERGGLTPGRPTTPHPAAPPPHPRPAGRSVTRHAGLPAVSRQ